MRTRVRGRRAPARDDHLHDPDPGTRPVLSRPDADVHVHVELSGASLTAQVDRRTAREVPHRAATSTD